MLIGDTASVRRKTERPIKRIGSTGCRILVTILNIGR